MTHPQLWLLDEPTRGLDYETRQGLIGLWRDFVAQGGAILLVTHDMTLVTAVADRVVMLQEGRIETADFTDLKPQISPIIKGDYTD